MIEGLSPGAFAKVNRLGKSGKTGQGANEEEQPVKKVEYQDSSDLEAK